MPVPACQATPTATTVTFQDPPAAFLAMQQGKVAAFVNEDQSLARALVQLGEQRKDYLMLPTSISSEPLALGIKKGEASCKKVVDDTLRELESSGKAEAMYEHWFGQQSALKLPKRSFKFETDKID